MNYNYCDLRGKKFGKLTAIKDVGRNRWGRVLWFCQCECGNKTVVIADNLRSGNTKSCGCFSNARKHGQSDTKLYSVWRSMKYRCSNDNDRAYHNYGGRGIKVCDTWLNFESFHDWAIASGYQEGLTIERIDNGKGYEPGNCTWIPKGRQSDNTRRCRFISYNGQTRNLKQWAKYLVKPYYLLQSRLKYGWDIDRAFNAPITLPSLHHVRLITYHGETKSIAQWSRDLGIGYKTLYGRLYRGQKMDQIATTIREANLHCTK